MYGREFTMTSEAQSVYRPLFSRLDFYALPSWEKSNSRRVRPQWDASESFNCEKQEAGEKLFSAQYIRQASEAWANLM